MRLPPAVLVTTIVCLGLVACGGDDRAGDAPAATSAPASEPGTALPRPAPGTCEPLPESADGRYVVADAGEVALRLEDGSVQLDVTRSSGWTSMAANTPIEAVVTFTRSDEELVLEAERKGGRLLIQVCAEDG